MAIPGVRDAISARSGNRIAVSPIVGGAAVRGPAGKIMAELGGTVSSVGVAREYRDLCDILVVDSQDADLADDISHEGIHPVVTNTIMNNDADKIALAKSVLELARRVERAV